MKSPADKMWQIRLADVKKSLEANNFEVFVVENASEAKNLVLKEIIPTIAPWSISWGGSMTFVATGLYDELKNAKTSILSTRLYPGKKAGSTAGRHFSLTSSSPARTPSRNPECSQTWICWVTVLRR